MGEAHDRGPGQPPPPPNGATHADESPYEKVRRMIQQPLDERKARVLLELIEDALKEPGVSPEKRAELRELQERAQAALPPTSFREVVGWVERGVLSLLPKGGRWRKVLLCLIGGGILLFGLYQSVERYWPKSETTPTPTPTPAASPPAPADAPVVTKAALEEYKREKFGDVRPLRRLDCTPSSCTWLVDVVYVNTAGLNVGRAQWLITYKRQGGRWLIDSANPK